MVRVLRRRPRLVAALLLLFVSAIWGSTFVVVKQSIAHTPVLDFLAWRFLLAGGLLVVLRPRALLRLGRREWRRGSLLGLALAAGYMTQTFGLESTPAAVSGFLTGLQVVFTPVIAWIVLRRWPGKRTWSATAVATVGLAVMTLRGAPFGLGETLTVVSAALFALQIVALEEWASTENAYGLAAVQLLTVGGVSLVAAAPGGISVPSTPSIWAAVVLTAVAATAFAFVVQTWAQSHLSATSAAVVFTTEPAFAALFALISGEPLGWALAVGGSLVVLAMLVMGVGGAGGADGSEGTHSTGGTHGTHGTHGAHGTHSTGGTHGTASGSIGLPLPTTRSPSLPAPAPPCGAFSADSSEVDSPLDLPELTV